MARRQSNENTLSEVLKLIIQDNKLQTGLEEVHVQDAWRNAMGNGVKAYTRNIKFKAGTLYVELTSAVLREELTHGKEKIIALLNEELKRDVIKDVVLR